MNKLPLILLTVSLSSFLTWCNICITIYSILTCKIHKDATKVSFWNADPYGTGLKSRQSVSCFHEGKKKTNSCGFLHEEHVCDPGRPFLRFLWVPLKIYHQFWTLIFSFTFISTRIIMVATNSWSVADVEMTVAAIKFVLNNVYIV